MTSAREKFQHLLRELFQIAASAELDFGIYRIMGQKREVVERFINEELLDVIKLELKTGALRDEANVTAQLAEIGEQIRENIDDDAIDAEGELDPVHHKTKLGRQYLALQRKAAGARSAEAHEASIYNHLYHFFSRYYDKGDFMSLRRYSKREKYAIPYNGEEVYLHWANADQYYIKTGETFTDYRWKAPSGSVRIRFTVTKANVPPDNIKAPDKRYFLPQLGEVTVETPGKAKDKDRHTLVTVSFHYRGLTGEEIETWEAVATDRKLKNGNGNGGKLQAAVLAAAHDELLAQTRIEENDDILTALIGEHHKDADGNAVSRLAHHLRRFTVKNTSDYFIHKDLGGFLTRELDFYLKNEVLQLDALEAGGEVRAEGWFQIMQVIRRIGAKIIAFLAQIENFQRRLFEKKKFVTECHYCMTLDRVPESLYPEIAKNKEQIAEWKELFAIDEVEGWSEPPTVEFFKAKRHLVVDTAFHSADVVDEILGSVDCIYDEVAGTLIHADNAHGLSLLAESATNAARLIYIDPPFNTSNDDFVYKDHYQHSSWLALIESRLRAAYLILATDGSFAVSIGTEELAHLKRLCDQVFGERNLVSLITVQRSTVSGHKTINPGVVNISEYVLVYAKNKANWVGNTVFAERDRDLRYNTFIRNHNEASVKWEFVPLLEEFAAAKGIRKSDLRKKLGDKYEKEVDQFATENASAICRLAIVRPDNVGQELNEALVASQANPTKVICVKRKGYKDTFFYGGQMLLRYSDKVRQIGDRLSTVERASDIWLDMMPNDLHNEGGVEFKKGKKPEALLHRLIELGSDPGDLIIDFFAGSATAPAVATKLCRKWIGIEFGAYFASKPLVRIKNVLSGENRGVSKRTDWKGRGICQYLRLESYEDALGNIAFNETGAVAQQQFNFDEYCINYMLAFETGESETLLNIEKLTEPFDYKLEIHNGEESTFKNVDLPETFNFLIGLRVHTRKVHFRKAAKQKVKYLVIRGRTNPHATGGEREVVVIWRTTKDWKQADFEADKEFIDENEFTKDSDEVFVNSDSFIKGSKSLDPVFKRRMFNEPD